MSQTDPSETHTVRQEIKKDFPFVVAIFRGITAIFLGIVLLIKPDKSSTLLANFMGFFWLSSGFLVLRRDSDEALDAIGKRTSRVVGIVAIVTGLLVVTRRITEIWVDHGLMVQMLGIVILLTGVLHVAGEVRIGRVYRSKRIVAHFILGVFEIFFGGMLFISPLDHGPVTYLVAMIWALVGGGTIIGTAVYDRFKANKSKKEVPQP